MSNKVYGTKHDFVLVRKNGGRIAVCYGKKPAEDEEHYTWYEVYFYIKKDGFPDFQKVKEAILNDINSQTDDKILNSFVWTSANGEKIPVWLSTENQFNFKSAYDLAVQKNGATLPVTFKMGETEDGEPVYHTFSTMEEADDFYTKAVTFINRTLAEGWQMKDSIDWEPYQETLEQLSAEEVTE